MFKVGDKVNVVNSELGQGLAKNRTGSYKNLKIVKVDTTWVRLKKNGEYVEIFKCHLELTHSKVSKVRRL